MASAFCNTSSSGWLVDRCFIDFKAKSKRGGERRGRLRSRPEVFRDLESA